MQRAVVFTLCSAMSLICCGCQPVADSQEQAAASVDEVVQIAATEASASTTDASEEEPSEPSISQSLEPVESDMHEFMEYVFQPSYKRLQAAMASEPADNAGWKAIKAEALVLAESGNLVILRGGDEDRAAWIAHASGSRTHGGKLYAAAREKNFAAAQEHYKAMLQSCNACHDQFAGGEHQLSP